MFDESTLRAEVVKVWGEYGAHVEVFDVMTMRAANLQAQITDLHALAESNQATIDRLLSEVKALRELADTQASIIAAKNAEIAQMRGDYAGALEADAELTGDVLAAGRGA